ncbi:lipid A-modifier LpxR family protein [Sagittula sp. SSi028]|uniref:lipid A-modifier LpxR family protein n=1 Tax=Sagittula sp. SSi028 TaxID=3400636 RepID=UPI003AF779C4
MIRRFAVAATAATMLAPIAQAQTFDADAYAGGAYDDAMPAYQADAAAQAYGGVDYGRRGFLGREVLGHGRLTTNDLFGDGNDRWQTGSVATSRVVGRGGWTGSLPQQPFDILEYRLSAQVIAPEDIRTPDAEDRPFAGALSLGVHTHFARGPLEMSAGANLVVTGSQTGLGAFQTAVHDALGVEPASIDVLDDQIDNDVHPTLVLEAGNPMGLGGTAVLRPFAEARAGVESMVRVGADLTLGTVGQGELMVRDSVTGQRYRAVTAPLTGFSYVVGGDIAYVDSSAFLPEDDGYEVSETRNRLRAGIHWQGERNAAFYGITYLSKEFEDQDSGQTVGSVRLDFKF